MTDNHEIITVSEAAKLCKVTRATIWRWIKSGLLKAGSTAGGHFRIYRRDILNLMKSKDMSHRRRSETVKFKILVVDDDSRVRKLYGHILNRKGFEIDFAANGFEAGLKTIKFQPHMVILDLFMPGMDGFEVCQHLKEHSDTKSIKIIAISGFESEENTERILQCGADRFFPKPLDMQMLIQEIQHLLV